MSSNILLVLTLVSFGGLCAAAPSKPETDQLALYTILHDLALPKFGPGKIVERFILLLPGQVLDYHDYCPLDAVEKKTEDPQDTNPDRLPPDENLFRLSDTLPTLYPLGGGISGKRLSQIYKDILYMIDTSKAGPSPFKQDSYTKAIEWLETPVEDPSGKDLPNVTRYELYYRYKKEYFDTNKMVRTWFATNRSSLNNLKKYEIWYDENYDSLMAYSSSAYIRWLISGLKGPVEDNIALVDVKSISEEVEDARRALQFEERPSMDGGSKYYPVHFVPGNWWTHLKLSNHPLSAEQIQYKINELTLRRDQIQAMVDSTDVPDTKNVDAALEKLNKNIKEKLAEQSTKLACYRSFCQSTCFSDDDFFASFLAKAELPKPESSKSCKYDQNINYCDEINKEQVIMDKLMQSAVEAKTHAESLKNEAMASKASTSSLKGIVKELDDQIGILQREYKAAEKPLPHEAATAKETVSRQQDLDDDWMSFTFDSEDSQKIVDKSSSASHFDSSVHGSFFVNFDASVSHSDEAHKFSSEMSKVDVSISAKLLRVTINRNWFRPSLFTIAKLRMQNDANKVSPGSKSDESSYIEEALKCDLPEYTTGFLLAKDVSMSFRGVHSKTISHAMKTSTAGSFSIGVGPFSAAASGSHEHESSHLAVSSHSDGLQINIPGAQIIGYFTSVLPEFPREDVEDTSAKADNTIFL